MSTTTATAALPGLDDIWRTLRGPLLVLAAGLAVLGVAFATEATAAYRVWMESTAYSHCMFVLPIALYLAWERRAEILATPIMPWPIVGLLALPAGAAWLVAERLGIMEGRQLVAVSLVELLFLATLGWRMAITLSAPLLYLYFLVPFGAFLTPLLQYWTSIFTEVGLNVLAIPHETSGYTIDIPGGRFYIAEACAGLRFLIASVAFGVLYAVLMYRSPGRRAAFIIASIAVPIIANWFRALGIVVMGYVLSSAEAAAADHIVYGWVFFSAITLLLIVIGLPFRQDIAAPAAGAPASVPEAARLVPATGLVVLLAVLAPALAFGLDSAARAPVALPGFSWTTPSGCRADAAVPGPVAGSEMVRFACPSAELVATAQVFSPRATWSGIGVAKARLSREGSAEDTGYGTLEGVQAWPYVLARGTPEGTFLTATALWTGGLPAKSGLSARVAMARQSLTGDGTASVLLSVGIRSPRESISPEEEGMMKRILSSFLQVQYRLNGEVSRLTQTGR